MTLSRRAAREAALTLLYQWDVTERPLGSLYEGELDIRGIPTTRDALLEIIDSDEFRSGDYSTSFIDEAGMRLPALAGA